jgi:hypothetical protein
MEFHLLGPAEAWADGRQAVLRSAKARCVVAVLLRTPGALVPTDTRSACADRRDGLQRAARNSG